MSSSIALSLVVYGLLVRPAAAPVDGRLHAVSGSGTCDNSLTVRDIHKALWQLPYMADKSNPISYFGRQVKKERLARGWGLVELSERTGIDAGHLSRIENGKRPPTEKVAKECDRVFAERRGWFLAWLEGALRAAELSAVRVIPGRSRFGGVTPWPTLAAPGTPARTAHSFAQGLTSSHWRDLTLLGSRPIDLFGYQQHHPFRMLLKRINDAEYSATAWRLLSSLVIPGAHVRRGASAN